MSFFGELPTDPAELSLLFAAVKQKEAEQKDHYAAIGKVAANWAVFEHLIDSRTIELGQLPLIPASCLTANISALRKLDAYVAMAKSLGTTLEKTLHTFQADAKSFCEQRNRVIHDPWILIAPRERALRFEITARSKLRAELVPMPTADVIALADKITDLCQRFADLSTSIAAELAPVNREPELEQQN